MLEYLKIMTKNLIPLQVALPGQPKPGIGMHGADQGVHNYLLRHNMTPPFQILSNEDSLVFTYDGCFKILPDGRVATLSSKAYAVVHQYNRNKNLQNHIFTKLNLI